MSNRSLKIWIWLHKWNSLVCTVFILVLCLTGLLEMPEGMPLKSLDEALQTALNTYPGEQGLFMSFDVGRTGADRTDAHHLHRSAHGGNRRRDHR